MRILLASSNKGKLNEILDLLQDVPLKVLLPGDLGIGLEVEEDGKTYAENALRKRLPIVPPAGW
jgi:XTP/dITP diphosphohydrolase